MHASPAFAFVQVPEARSIGKPRQSGLTSLLDYGMPLRSQADLLETAGHLIDIAKIATATSRVYDETILVRKLETYASSDIDTQMGGQFTEFVFATKGLDGVRQLFEEASRVGFDIVEISDTCRPIEYARKQNLVEAAFDAGLRVVCEVGLYKGSTDTKKLLQDIEFALQLEVERVIVEGAELVDDNGFRQDIVERIRRSLDVDRLIFELPGPGITDASPDKLESLKRGLVMEFGPDVSIGNLLPEEIVETEVIRIGIEDCDAWPDRK